MCQVGNDTIRFQKASAPFLGNIWLDISNDDVQIHL